MRSIKLVGLAFFAVLALGAVSATSASAVELIKFSKTGNFTGKSVGTTTLEASNGKTVVCKSAEGKGKVESEILALALILFKECTSKTSFGEATCTSSGSPSGEIHIPHLLILLGSDSGTEDNPAVLLLPSNPSTGAAEPVKFKCSLLLEAELTVKGSVICLVKNDSTKTKVEVLCEKEGTNVGVQRDKHFWDKNQTNVEDFLKSTATGAETFSELESAQISTGLLEGEGTTIQIEV